MKRSRERSLNLIEENGATKRKRVTQTQYIQYRPNDGKFIRKDVEKKPEKMPKRQLTMNELPDEILKVIFQYFEQAECIFNLGRVNKRWYRLVRSKEIWQKTSFKGFRKVRTLMELISMIKTIWREPFDIKAPIPFKQRYKRHKTIKTPIQHIIFPFLCAVADESNQTPYEQAYMQLNKICPNIKSIKFQPIMLTQHSMTDKLLGKLKSFQNLEALDLSTHDQITDQGILTMAQQLKKLNLCYCSNISSESLTTIVKSTPFLQSLRARHGSSAFGMPQLKQFKSFSLTHLDICVDKELPSNAFESLLYHCPCIESLHIHEWKYVSEQAIENIAKKFNRLKVLEISADITTSKLYHFSIKSRTLKHITLSHFQRLDQFEMITPNLKTMTLNSIDEMGGYQGILQLQSLETLDMSNVRFISDKWIQMISQIPNLKKMTLFNGTGLEECHLDIPSLQQCSIALCSFQKITLRGPIIQKVKVDGCMDLKELTLDTPKMQTLQLFELISREFPELETLSVKSHELEVLSFQRCVNIDQLHIESNSLKALNVSECKKLSKLSLFCSSLSKLALSAPLLTMDIPFIKQLTFNCPEMTMLSISNVLQLNDEAFEYMTKYLPRLVALIMKHCNSLISPTLFGPNLSGCQFIGCTKLTSVSFFSQLPILKKLVFRENPNLKVSVFESLNDKVLPNLIYLEIKDAHKLEWIPINFYRLQWLHLINCTKLQYVGLPTQVGILTLKGLPSFLNFATIPQQDVMMYNQNCIENITIDECPNIVDDFYFHPSLQQLTQFTLMNCKFTMASVCLLSNQLNTCRLKNITNLNNLRIENTVVLSHVLFECVDIPIHHLTEIIPLHQSAKWDLRIKNCPNMKDLSISPLHTNLLNIYIDNCYQLHQLYISSNAKHVSLELCPSVVAVHIQSLSNESVCNIEQCAKLGSISIQGVQSLMINNCPSIAPLSLQQALYSPSLKEVVLCYLPQLSQITIPSDSLINSLRCSNLVHLSQLNVSDRVLLDIHDSPLLL